MVAVALHLIDLVSQVISGRISVHFDAIAVTKFAKFIHDEDAEPIAGVVEHG